MVFAQPNMSIIGLIDLDDTENAIASKTSLASRNRRAPMWAMKKPTRSITWVYNADQSANSRMVSALKYFNASFGRTGHQRLYDFNVDAEGNIVPMYATSLDHPAPTPTVGYYDIEGIGSASNLEVHIFQVFEEDSATDTVE